MQKLTTTVFTLLLIIVLQNKTIFSYYQSVSIMPYQWDKNGTLWILLGKEKHTSTQVWSDLYGKKEKKNEKPLQTALKIVKKETAGQLKIRRSKNESFSYQDGSTIHFILPAHYINPKNIEAAVQRSQNKDKKLEIEKTEWQWVQAENLLREKTNLALRQLFNRTLQERKIRVQLRQLIAEKPTILLKRAYKNRLKRYKPININNNLSVVNFGIFGSIPSKKAEIQ